ncbi:MAG: hypothetical protein NTX25_01410 [Proteobacteria bacterium]|nr:hypothetical protein [Pseudomonadota bacterium]
MNSQAQILEALNHLDELLCQDNNTVEIIVCGGFIVDRRYGFRTSDDLDVLSPGYNLYLATAANSIRDRWPEVNVSLNWLNWAASENLGVDKGLSPGWETRALAAGTLFEGDKGCLKVYGLAKADLVATKLAAYVSDERKKDLDDLAMMGATPEDVELVLEDVVALMRCRGIKIADKLASKSAVEMLKHALRYIATHDIKDRADEFAKMKDK